MSNPEPFKNTCIAFAASCGLAVNIKISLLPNLPFIFWASSKKGPFLPFITFLNSSKLNLAPCSCNSTDFLANSVAFILVSLPFGIVTITLLCVLANVSSKSKTLIPFSGFVDLEKAIASSYTFDLSNNSVCVIFSGCLNAESKTSFICCLVFCFEVFKSLFIELPKLSIFNTSPNVFPVVISIILFGSIPPSILPTVLLKYLSHHLLFRISQPSGIVLANLPSPSFLLSTLSNAINL